MATSMAPSRNFNPASSDRAAGAVAVLDRVREPARGEGVAHHADIVDATGAQRLGQRSLGLLRPDPDHRGCTGNRLLTAGVAVLQHDGALLDAIDVRVRTGGDALLVEGPQRRDARDGGQLTEDLEEPRDHGHLLALASDRLDHPPHLLVVRHVLGQPDLATERVTLLEDRHAMATLRGHTGGLES